MNTSRFDSNDNLFKKIEFLFSHYEKRCHEMIVMWRLMMASDVKGHFSFPLSIVRPGKFTGIVFQTSRNICIASPSIQWKVGAKAEGHFPFPVFDHSKFSSGNIWPCCWTFKRVLLWRLQMEFNPSSMTVSHSELEQGKGDKDAKE